MAVVVSQSQSGLAKAGPLPRKVLTGSCVVLLVGTASTKRPVRRNGNPNASLAKYMTHAAENFANIPIPLGGKLTRIDATTMEMVVPRFELFDVWMQPRAQTHVAVYGDYAEVTSGNGDCVLEGSHHIQSLKLQELYNLDVRITFKWDDVAKAPNPQIFAKGKIEVEVDIPLPFAIMPAPIIKAGGDLAMNTVLNVMMPSFMDKLASDYNEWAVKQPVA
ncbi:hypothetical protein FOA52_012625 [Chlamydomonas sp. UWO 241]|nr:hypothetical protein FOA52_012625 [Chlamydomonas sp. UWO 241]